MVRIKSLWMSLHFEGMCVPPNANGQELQRKGFAFQPSQDHQQWTPWGSPKWALTFFLTLSFVREEMLSIAKALMNNSLPKVYILQWMLSVVIFITNLHHFCLEGLYPRLRDQGAHAKFSIENHFSIKLNDGGSHPRHAARPWDAIWAPCGALAWVQV